MSKDDPTFSIKDELRGSGKRCRPRNLRMELGEEEYRKSLIRRTMDALSVSERYTEAMVKRMHQSDSLRMLLPSSTVDRGNEDNEASIKSKKRKADDSPTDAKSGKMMKQNDGSVVCMEPTYINSQGLKVSNRQPKLLEGAVMRDYQLDGLDWMVALDLNGANGILADEMGLGKTLQVISLICFFVDLGVGAEAPFLVIGPLSTLHNWEAEFQKFAPKIPVVLYHGKQDERILLKKKILEKKIVNDHESYPVVITSYEMPLKDQDLRKINWRYLIIDEGHRLKNHNCLLIKELRRYHTVNRLLLTGTPLQNNMTELWSLLNFILPGVVNDMDVFESWFDASFLESSDSSEKIVEAEQKDKVLTTLHKIMKPFLMRRVKADVGLNIPPKKEILIYAPMTEWQQRLQSAVVDKTLSYLQGKQPDFDPLEIERALRRASKVKQSPVKVITVDEIGKEVEESLESTFAAADENPAVKKAATKSPSKTLLSSRTSPRLSKICDENSPSGKTMRHSKRISGGNVSMEKLPTPSSTPRPSRAKRRSSVNPGDYKLLANGVPLNAIREEPAFSYDSSDLEINLDASKDKLLEGLAAPDEEFVTEMKITNPVALLRKICNHPYLASFPVLPGTRMLKIDENIVQRSGKMKVLDALLRRLKQNGHKVLIFSNFTQMLDIIEDYLLMREYLYTRLDGTRDITDRQMNIKKFSSDDDVFVFLISTRAGGLGINLVAADTVIIFDSDWNPQVDLQAQDRCHRIGQTKPVAVYRFVVRGTIDEQIIKRAETKKQLDKLVIQHGKFKNFKKNEVVSLQELRQLLTAKDCNEFTVDSNLVYTEKELDELCDRNALFSSECGEKTAHENDANLGSDADSDNSDSQQSFDSLSCPSFDVINCTGAVKPLDSISTCSSTSFDSGFSKESSDLSSDPSSYKE